MPLCQSGRDLSIAIARAIINGNAITPITTQRSGAEILEMVTIRADTALRTSFMLRVCVLGGEHRTTRKWISASVHLICENPFALKLHTSRFNLTFPTFDLKEQYLYSIAYFGLM